MSPRDPEAVQAATIAALMQDLTHSQGWACFEGNVRGMILASLEQLVQQPADRAAGYIEGLRAALSLPDQLIARGRK